MAEIHVQMKRRSIPVWLWIVVILVIIGAVAVILVFRNNKKTTVEQTRPATFVQPEKPVSYYLM